MKKYTVEKYCASTTHRWDIINYIINKHRFLNYLEIGVNDGMCIRQIRAAHKDGVDPYPGSEHGVYMNIPEVNYPITSDEFFNLIKGSDIKYDIIFIDGLHHADQVDKDVENSLNHIVDNGFIILHDCNPPEYEMQLVPRVTGMWNGDVWKSIAKLRCLRNDLEVSVIDTDWGVGVVKKGNQEVYDKAPLDTCLTYEYLDQNRDDLLNIISVEGFYSKY